MKTIYTKENFLHINLDYPNKTFSVFLDNIQTNLSLKEEADYINIPINRYSYISFPKQYAKYVSISNERKLTQLTTRLYEERGFKKYKDITFAEVINGTPNNLIFLFTENDKYIDKFEDVASESLKLHTKLIILKDDFLQYGSDYLFRNNGELLIESLKAFITEKSIGYDPNNISIIASRSAAKAGKMYSTLFPKYKLVTFNTEEQTYSSEACRYRLEANGLKLSDGIEISSYQFETLSPSQLREQKIIVNTKQYSFVETMRLAMFYTQINNNLKAIEVLPAIDLKFEKEVYKLPTEIQSQPLFAYIQSANIVQQLDVFSYGGEYYIKQVPLVEISQNPSLSIITEDKIYTISTAGVKYD